MDTPTVRPLQWWRTIPQLAGIALAAWGGWALGLRPWLFVLVAAVFVVLGYRYLAIRTVMRHHTRGMRLVREEKFAEAAEAFKRSLDFFSRFPPLDTWRSILFLSPGRYGYREMALTNLGYCYGRTGEYDKAVACFRTCLELHPDNGLARAALGLLEAGGDDEEKP